MTRDKSQDELPDYIKCVHNKQRGLLLSSPPQCICEYCGQTWIYETPAPVCSVLKAVYDATLQDVNPTATGTEGSK